MTIHSPLKEKVGSIDGPLVGATENIVVVTRCVAARILVVENRARRPLPRVGRLGKKAILRGE